jgi:anti-sigma B factor antagonist
VRKEGDEMDFDIATERPSEGVFVIALSGEVDLYTAPEFKQQVINAVDEGARHVVVDLSETTFIDSTTLGVLIGGVRRLREHDGDLSLVCSDRNISKIFEITGLDRVFSIATSREDALARLAQ